MVDEFKLRTDFTPKGDQPKAISELTEGLIKGDKHQVLLGVTGSGKTFTIANVIKNVNRPAIVIAHNKALAAQLYGEFRESSRKTQSNSSSAIMTITSPRPTSRHQIPTSRKTR